MIEPLLLTHVNENPKQLEETWWTLFDKYNEREYKGENGGRSYQYKDSDYETFFTLLSESL
jgi:hypothetical protein